MLSLTYPAAKQPFTQGASEQLYLFSVCLWHKNTRICDMFIIPF